MKVAVVGLGMAGLPLACVIADTGFTVVGVDLDQQRCNLINEGKNPIPEEQGLDALIQKHGGSTVQATTKITDAKTCTLFIIIVPLFIDEQHNPVFHQLETAFQSVGSVLKKGDCVVLETTVPPTTTETKGRQWLEQASGLVLGDFYLAYSPERIMTGVSVSRLREFPKIIGGVNTKSGDVAYQLYKQFIPHLSSVSSARLAEFIKVIEGCYRFTNIALANELYLLSQEYQLDFDEARTHANHEFCHIHEQSTGVGGHCIPVYPWFLMKHMEEQGKKECTKVLQASYHVNDEMIQYWADRIITRCQTLEIPLEQVTICIQGISFRKGIKNTYYSRNLALARLLMKKGMHVVIEDPLFSAQEIQKLGLTEGSSENADVIFNPFELQLIIQEKNSTLL